MLHSTPWARITLAVLAIWTLAPAATARGAISEGEARDVIRLFEGQVVAPALEIFGARLTFTLGDPWITAQAIVAASAERSGPGELQWDISFFGPGVRHPSLTRDAFILLLCHELGHHFGGAPRKQLGPDVTPPAAPAAPKERWASAEGQSDFYATTVCAKRIFALTPAPFFDSFVYPSEIVDFCAPGRPNRAAQLDCARSVIAARSFMASLGDRAIDWRATDPTRVLRTVGLQPDPRDGHYEYPSDDCRMQTLREGARCYRVATPTVADLMGRGSKDPYCARPTCWYAP